LEKHDLGDQIFEVVKAHLKANGMAMKQGTIIDATLIAAPRSLLRITLALTPPTSARHFLWAGLGKF
jgi:IS5 family transposase